MSEVIKKPLKVGAFSGGLAARKKAAAEQMAIEKPIDPRTIVTLKPEEMPERIGIVMDDSGSMSGQQMKDAHDGIEEFLRCCKPTTTSVAIYPMNAEPIRLNTTLPQTAILVKKIQATDSTPLLETLVSLKKNESITRAIVFSDGSPDNQIDFEKICSQFKESNIPVDTVYIASTCENSYAEYFMKKLADLTGGIYMKFEAGRSTFKNSFKYLAPVNRAMLMNADIKTKVERGEM